MIALHTYFRDKGVLAALCLVMTMLLISSCAFFPSQENKKRARLHLKIGTSYLARGDYPDALNQLLLAAKLDPRSPIVQHNLGLAYFVRKKYILAERHMRRALQLEKKYTEARNNLARVLIELSLYQEAIDELNISLADLTFPHPNRTLFYLGLANFKLKEFQQSSHFLSQSLDIEPKDCSANNLLGRSYFELKKYSQASKFLDQAINLCKGSRFDEPFYYSALNHYQMGRRNKAVTILEEMMHRFPKGKYLALAKEALTLIK